MNRLRIVILVLFAALLGACGWHASPEQHARKFFDEGKDLILSSLKKQESSDAQLAAAREVLERHEKTVPGEIAAVLRQQRALLRGITGGQGMEPLIGLEAELHRTQEQAARAIGRMHDDLASAVGEPTWKGTTAALDKRMARYFRD